jgi:hypothetical protein
MPLVTLSDVEEWQPKRQRTSDHELEHCLYLVPTEASLQAALLSTPPSERSVLERALAALKWGGLLHVTLCSFAREQSDAITTAAEHEANAAASQASEARCSQRGIRAGAWHRARRRTRRYRFCFTRSVRTTCATSAPAAAYMRRCLAAASTASASWTGCGGDAAWRAVPACGRADVEH